LPIFTKKSDDEKGGGHAFSVDKARRWFEQARTVHEATNYEYAMSCWLSGMRFDPTDLTAMEGFWRSASAFHSEGPRKPSKELRKSFADRGDNVSRFVGNLLDWGAAQFDPAAAVSAAEAAAKLHGESGLSMKAVAEFIAERALGLVSRNSKGSGADQKLFLRLLDACEKTELFEIAVRAGDAAVKLKPADVALSQRVRNMAAAATMSTGGYDTAGQQGGFMRNIRDAAKQAELAAQDTLVKTDDVKAQLIEQAEKQLSERPDDTPTMNKLVKALLDRGRPEDEKRAYKLLNDAYEQTSQFQFRERAGDIRLKQAKRKLTDYIEAGQAEGATEDDKRKAEQARRKYLEMELDELRLRVENYPTDVALKYRLGAVEFELGNIDEAIALFQDSKDDAKHRARSLSYLGRAFLMQGWLPEAIGTFREALESHNNHSDSAGLELRYGLMTALQQLAQQDRELDAAREAEQLASKIAIQQINFKDIRERRDAIKSLINDLKSG